MYDDYRDNGFIPLAININEALGIVLQYARLYTYPFLRDNGSVWSVYRQSGAVPLNYVVGPDGIIRYVAEGFNEAQIHAVIRQYLPDPIDHDVGVTRILRPTSAEDSGTTVVPACSVYNYGEHTETYQVRMRIGTHYDQVATVTGHAPGELRYVEFPTWTVLERGQHAVRCTTELPGDDIPSNSHRDIICQGNVYDIAVLRMFAPADTVDSAQTVVPSVEVHNLGTVPDIIKVRFEMSDGYWDTTSVILHPDRLDTLQLGPWTPQTLGVFQARCSVWGRWEMVWENNVIERTVRVVRTGVAEEAPGLLPGPDRVPMLVRGILNMPADDAAASLHDASGRKVMALVPGENDVRHLAPGVYFVRTKGFEGSNGQEAKGSRVTKVVLER